MSGTALRVLTAVVLLPLVIGVVGWGPLYLVAVFSSAIIAVALWEFFAMAGHMGIRAYCTWTGLAAVAILVQQWSAGRDAGIATTGALRNGLRVLPAGLDLVLVVFLLGLAAIALARNQPVGEFLPSVSISAASLLFIVLPFSAVIRLAAVGGIGRKLLFFTLVLVWVGDTAAYFAGRSFGKRKLSPQWSPNKTWEGAAANLVGALVVAMAFARWIRIVPLPHLLVMAVLASIAGQIGDVFESALKRSAGVKDSGSILPGHGGMYDRIDALIFAAPVVWYYFEWVVRTARAVSGSF